jgi:hypothetical protein
MDMLNGEWHVFLEYFEANIPSQIEAVNLKVCLPDSIRTYANRSFTYCNVEILGTPRLGVSRGMHHETLFPKSLTVHGAGGRQITYI